MMLKVLDLTLVFFSRFQRIESAQVAALIGFRVFFPRIDPVFARFQLAYHIRTFTGAGTIHMPSDRPFLCNDCNNCR